MPTQLQLRRGTTAQNNSFTGAAGELSIDTQTENIRVHDGSLAGGQEIIPSGSLVPFGGATVPAGWLLCNDQAVSRTTYARLFAIIASGFGSGDGTTTFNVPDLRDRLPLGKGTNNSTLGAETTGASASAVKATASGSAALTLATASFATSAKDSSTATAVTGVTAGGHTHNLTIPCQVFNYLIKT